VLKKFMRFEFDSSLATQADYMSLGIFLEVADRHRIHMSALWTEDVDGWSSNIPYS
jgi:hypothetical protein